VETTVEAPVESRLLVSVAERGPPALNIRMLGPLTITARGWERALPPSRKVRALLAYLSLAPHPVQRARLCELLWDVPNDPRGELRWCLSKIRTILDEPARRRVVTQADTVCLDLADCCVDATDIALATQAIEAVDAERARTLVASFGGEFLDGLELEHSAVFTGWLTAQRRRFRGCHVALLERLVACNAPDDDGLTYLESWLELAPFDRCAHTLLLKALARRDQVREAEEHLAATTRLFETEGLDAGDLRDAWRSARAERGYVAPHPTILVAPPPKDGGLVAAPRRASIAVMPFVDWSCVADARGGAPDALAHDVITRLAKLRNLFVIAQGTVFALRERGVSSEEAGRMLNVDYVVSGSVLRKEKRLTVNVELAESRTARIIWAETFNEKDDALGMLDDIGDLIVGSIASEIEASERKRAILRPPNSLDAWEAYHRGLWHAYRFNRADNARARHFFAMATRLDPTFARAHAGVSFTHFQNAFQGWAPREPEVAAAFEAAGQSLMVDDLDPGAHLAMGRAFWLRGQHDRSVTELQAAVDLSPNFSFGHYTLAFVHSQMGNPEFAISSADYSRSLSPFDPMLFGMLGARALALVRLARFDEAADCGVKAAARPNAHAHILAISALTLALAGRLDDARAYLVGINKIEPGYCVDDFLTAFQFEPDGERLFRNGAKRIGMT
jgi:DNA-binding SARP family transcriptional activator/TolB-like protein